MCALTRSQSNCVLRNWVTPFGNLRITGCSAPTRRLSQLRYVLHRHLVSRHPPSTLMLTSLADLRMIVIAIIYHILFLTCSRFNQHICRQKIRLHRRRPRARVRRFFLVATRRGMCSIGSFLEGSISETLYHVKQLVDSQLGAYERWIRGTKLKPK